MQNEHLLPEDYGMLAGVEDVNGTSPLRLARYDALLGDFPQTRLWQLTGTQYVLTTRDDLYAASEVVAELPGAAQAEAAAGDAAAVPGPSLVHRLVESHPRAWVVSSLRTADDAAALPQLGDGGLDLARTALLPPAVNGSGRPTGLEDGVLANAGPSEVRVEQLAPGRLRIHVKSENGGYLVVSENWLPGWQATIQEGGPSAAPVEAPVLRTNLTFLGLPVAAGEQTVELSYRPASVRWGLLIGGLTILLLACALIVRRRDVNLPGSGNLGGLTARVNLGGLAARVNLGGLGILLLAFALRIFRLGYQELRGDEALGRLFSLESLPVLVRSTIQLREPHPVASYAIQGAWLKLAGHTEFALRFVSAWFGVLAVALIYRLARRLGLDRGVAALAAGLLAISPYAIWHSQDARMYSISLALTLASTVLMLEALARWPSGGATGRSPHRAGARGRAAVVWAAYVIITWLALQTHYYAAYIIVAQNVFVLGRAIANREERRLLAPWFAVQAATFLLYLPWLIAARSTLTGYVGNGDSPGFAAMWLRSLGVFAVGETMPSGQRAAAGVLVAILALIGALRLSRSACGRRALWLLAPYLLAPLLITWAGALARPIFNERYIIAALPGLILMMAGVASTDRPPVNGRATRQRPLKRAYTGQPRPKSPVYGALLRSPDIDVRAASPVPALIASLLAVLLVATLASLLHYYDDPAYSKSRGWRQVAAVLDRYSRGWPADEVRLAQTYPDPTLWYYATSDADHLVLPPAANDESGARELVNQLAAQGVQRVVVAVQPDESWDDQPNRTEDARGSIQPGRRDAGWRLARPDLRPCALGAAGSGDRLRKRAAVGWRRCSQRASISGRFRSGHHAVAGPGIGNRPGGQGLSGNEKITLQLLDAGNKVVSQLDQPFDRADLEAGPATYSLPLPRVLPGGSYRLIVALYDPSREGSPRLPTLDGRDHVVLKEFASQ